MRSWIKHYSLSTSSRVSNSALSINLVRNDPRKVFIKQIVLQVYTYVMCFTWVETRSEKDVKEIHWKLWRRGWIAWGGGVHPVHPPDLQSLSTEYVRNYRKNVPIQIRLPCMQIYFFVEQRKQVLFCIKKYSMLRNIMNLSPRIQRSECRNTATTKSGMKCVVLVKLIRALISVKRLVLVKNYIFHQA